MYSTTSRFRGWFTRVGLVVAVAIAVLAATPRSASAGVIICAGGKCEWAPGNCGIYKPLPSGYLCADIATAALRNPHLLRDGAGASFIDNGKTTPIMSDAADALLQKVREACRRMQCSNQMKSIEIDKLWKDFDAAFRSGDRRVSDQRLQSISKELGLPIERQRTGLTGGMESTTRDRGGNNEGQTLRAEPIPGIDIIVRKKPGGVRVAATVSDASGRFSVRVGEPGQYTVSTACRSANACQPYTVSLTASGGLLKPSADGTYEFTVGARGPVVLSGQITDNNSPPRTK